ncbi:MAG: hypothetical protein DRN29_09275 [Thermoplasmata archaeon]|nr:MAG: hypothetical protein DRN29_09275 [Thermoplasmata archaeon]
MPNHATHQSSNFLWNARGGVFLIFSFIGLTCGMFPKLFLPSHRADLLSTPAALKVMFVSQVIFVVMFLPLMTKRSKAGLGRFLVSSAAEYIIWLGVLLPLYIVAGVLADATVIDVIRCLLYLTGIVIFAWTLGLWAQLNQISMTVVAFISSLIVVALPVIYYFFIEFSVRGVAPKWLIRISPVNHILNLAYSGGTSWYPEPIWTLLIWLLSATAAVLVYLPFGSMNHHEENLPDD